MLFYEYQARHLVNERKDETERISANAWKFHGVKKETIFQKAARRWTNRPKTKVVQPNCGCACQS